MHVIRNLVILLLAALPAAPWAAADVEPVEGKEWTFERSTAGWNYISCTGGLATVPTDTSPMNRAMRLDVQLPMPASMYTRVHLDTGRINRVAYRVYLPDGAPYTVKSLFYLKDKDGLWFQDLREEALEPGQWNTHVVDLSHNSVELEPRGHFRRWNSYLSHKMNLFGIKFISVEEYRGPVYVDDIRPYYEAESTEPLRVLNFRVNAPKVKRFGKFEITFQLNRSFSNVFDPEQVDIRATFTAPSGTTLTIPGFYYQEFINSQDGSEEVLTPIGQGCWKVRFAPTEVGTHTFTVRVKAGSEQLETAPRTFAAAPSDDPGFVRVSKKDYRCFEFDNGDLFYPIGHNFRSPNDPRCAKMLGIPVPPDRGTYAYEDIFPKMAAAGENLAEVWMCSWWLDIEWIPDWKHYQGLGDYNLANAWKLDRVLKLAHDNGIRVHLVIDNHGKISTWCDPEWKVSPYNKENGGILDNPELFFTDPRAKELYRRKMRYIIGRWAYDTTIAGFELWSELDLTGLSTSFMRNPVKAQWHREMADYIKSIDPWKHILTTHYSTTYARIDPSVVSLPQIDYVAVDAYRQGRDQRSIGHLITETYQHCKQWRKPHFITEYGGSPWGNSRQKLESDLHSGIWAGYMLPMVGTPLLWWFDFIDRGYSGQAIDGSGLYGHFRALANYARGEERRDPNLGVGTITVSDSARLKAMCLQSRDRAYCWIYDESCMQSMRRESQARLYDGITVNVFNLNNGAYDIEFWDTYKGIELKDKPTTARTENGALRFTLPPFKRDIAVKIKPHGRRPAMDTSTPPARRSSR